MRILLPTLLLCLTAPLAAQEPESPRFRIAAGLGGGYFDYDTDGSTLSGDTDAGFFRLQFEGTTRSGFGGGLRLESYTSDDDLFVDEGFTASEARNGNLFAHFTYRFEQHRFAMPVRIGLMLNGLTLEEQGTGNESTYGSAGPYFELAPEITIARRGAVSWSLYGEFGVGVGGTVAEFDGDSNEYDSASAFLGLELGTRLQLSAFEIGIAYLGRWQSMDESDDENGLVALGYDAQFQGLLVTVGVVF